jgi:hypothetical protein
MTRKRSNSPLEKEQVQQDMTYISTHTDRVYICAKSKFWKSRGTMSKSCETNRKWHGHVQQTIFLPKVKA